MPRLVKGGKWVYAWVIVGPEGEVIIPPEAWREYGFQAGDEVIFLLDSLGLPRGDEMRYNRDNRGKYDQHQQPTKGHRTRHGHRHCLA